MKAIDRLYVYLEYKGTKPTRFEKEVGLSNGYLNTQAKRAADLGESVLNKIIDYCLDINLVWLLTGRGEMLLQTTGEPVQAPASPPAHALLTSERETMYIERIAELTTENKGLNREIGAMGAELAHTKGELAKAQAKKEVVKPPKQQSTDERFPPSQSGVLGLSDSFERDPRLIRTTQTPSFPTSGRSAPSGQR